MYGYGRRRQSYGYGMSPYSRPSYGRKRAAPKGLKAFKRINKKFPIAKYGRSYHLRGTPENVGTFGSTWKDANDMQKAARTKFGYSGKGAYRGRGGYWGRLIGRGLGSMVGLGDWGAKQGDAIGDWADSKARGIAENAGYSGAGAYETNTLIDPVPGDTRVMRMQSSMDETGALTIQHKEYVGDVQGSTSFQNTAYLVNPTNAALFPFLSQFACNFDEYDFNQIIIHYKSVTTELSTTSQQMGTIIMVADYNAGTKAQFPNKQSMMQYDGSVSSRVCDNISFGIECDASKNAGSAIRYTPPMGDTPVGEDPKTYQTALFQIAVNQSIATGQIGELWVEYSVTLRKPKFCQAIGLDLPYIGSRIIGTSLAIPLAVPAGTVVPVKKGATYANPTFPSMQISITDVSYNDSTMYYIGTTATLEAARAALQTNVGNTNTWFLWSATETSTLTNTHICLPDIIGTGTFEFTTIQRSGAGLDTGIVASIGSSANITFKLTENDRQAGLQTTSVIFTVNSSAINVGLGGPTQTGSYISVANMWNGAHNGFQARSFRLRKLNPQETLI